MLVRHFMTAEVLTLSPETACGEALKEFRRRRVRRAPVVEKGRLVGMVSERDLLRVLPGTPGQASTCEGAECLAMPVRRIMHQPVITLQPNDHLAAAAKLMLAHRIGGLPVVHRGEIKGIITESDVFKALFGILTAPGGSTLIFEEPAGGGGDWAAACSRRGGLLRGLLRCPRPEGGMVAMLSFAGGDPDGLAAELASAGCRVIRIDR